MKTTSDITQAVAILRNGGLVAFPTETVYGLGADARNQAAVRKIFAAKERPYDHPLIVHIADFAEVGAWARAIPKTAERLAKAFWPGPLTMILQRQPGVLDVVTGGQDTVGIRMPKHPVALALLQAFGSGVVAPSANKFTHISPTSALAVQQELGGEVDLILDGGACAVGLESTIIDLSQDQPVILRPGMITAAVIEVVLGESIASSRQDTPVVRAPGMHHLHYAPVTRTVMFGSGLTPVIKSQDLPCAVVWCGERSLVSGVDVQHVFMSPVAEQYAHDLYHTLRGLDGKGLRCIMLEGVPAGGEWEAIRDRIGKACGGRGPSNGGGFSFG